MLGSGINPESFKLDYSGMANAAATQAQGVANLGASIGGAISEVGDYFKKQAEDEKKVQKSLSVAKAIGDLIPGLQPTIQGSLNILNDKELPLSQRTAEADAISDILNLGINEVRNRQNQEFQQASLEQDAAYKKAQLEIAQQNANSRAQSAIAAGKAPPATTDMPLGDGSTARMQWDGESQSYVPIRVSGLGGANQAVKGDDLIGLVKGFEGFNPRAYNDYKQISIGYGTKGKEGEVLNEEQATERLKSELSGHAERIAKAAELKGIALNKNQFNALTSFDYNTGRGANLIERFGDNPQQLASKILEYTKAGGEDLPGLVKRRQIEAALFLAPEEQAVGASQVTPQNQPRIGVTPAKPQQTSRIVTGEEAMKLGATDPQKEYIVVEEGGTTIRISPTSTDTIGKNVKAYEAAGSLYKAGDRLGALNILRALKARDIYGDITDQTLDEYMKTYSSTTPSSTETTPNQSAPTKRPLGEIIK